ncbi:ABC transporter ATP-binding protein [Sphaerisporangium sp. NBC_01403]|uniref:ABC transporter ATP-binding protein n=1 Tax=Sphaerisporangium sp. NBC_01403 TaxID=2903599 RepID=UPI003254A063
MSSPASVPLMPGAAPAEPGDLLRVERLSVFLPAGGNAAPILDDVTFTVRSGRTTGLIGESGSGKTMLAMAVIGLLPPRAATTGSIRLRQEDLLAAGDRRRRQVRGSEISMIFQDPVSALNPSQRIGRQVGEFLRRNGASRRRAARAAVELLSLAGIPDAGRRARDYPHQFSGGMRQRAMIALALAGEPSLVLADEPTTALDVTVQARILRLLRTLQDERHMSMLLVSHDLRVMSHVSHDLVVLYAGRVCERGPTRELLRAPRHPYTKALAASVPAVRATSPLVAPLPGAPASPLARPGGCAFHPRCPMARERCATEVPAVREVAPGRWSACHFAEEVAA